MAITITVVPAANLHTLSDNPMMFYMTSTNVAQVNFSIILKVYVDGGIYSTHQVFPRPDDTISFDASGIAKAVCPVLLRRTVQPTTPVDFWFTTPNYVRDIYITAQERYGTIPTLQGSVVTSNTVRCWKGRLKELQFTTWNGLLTRFQSEQPTRGKMLTDYPRNERRLVLSDEPFYLGIYARNPNSGGYNCYRITFFNNAGGVITAKQVRIENTIGDHANYMPDLSLSHLVSSGLITQGEADTTKFYRISVAWIDVGQTLLGEFMDVYKFTGCNFGQTIYFLNRYGQFESFPFIKRTISSTGVKGASVDTYNDTLNAQEDGEFDYIRIAENRIKLKTDWLTEGVYNWLRRELVESPYILTEIDGVLSRCKVMASSTNQQQHALDIMFDFEVDLQVSLKDYSAVV
jgi:hypothetical protein